MTSRSRTHVPSRSVGSGASHSWSTCAPASERPSATLLVREQVADRVDVVVGDVRAEAGRRGPRRPRARTSRRAGRTPRSRARSLTRRPCSSGKRCRLRDLERLPARLHRRLLEVGRGQRPPRRDRGTRRCAPRGSTFMQLAEHRAGVEAVRVGHRELHRERPRRDLRPHVARRRARPCLVQPDRLEVLAARAPRTAGR